MTEEQIEVILNKLAKEAKYEAYIYYFSKMVNYIEIKQNFFGDQYWICGRYSIGVAKICRTSKDDYSYRLKLFFGNNTEKSKQNIVEENYLEELESFIDLMLSKLLKSCEKVYVFEE